MRNPIIFGKTRFTMIIVSPDDVLAELISEHRVPGCAGIRDASGLPTEYRVMAERLDTGYRSIHLAFDSEAQCDAAMDSIERNAAAWNEDEAELEITVNDREINIGPDATAVGRPRPTYSVGTFGAAGSPVNGASEGFEVVPNGDDFVSRRAAKSAARELAIMWAGYSESGECELGIVINEPGERYGTVTDVVTAQRGKKNVAWQ
jgi:hypothetical protein